MENIRIFLSENFRFLAVKFSVYFNRRVFVMSENARQMIYMKCQALLSLSLSLKNDTHNS